MEIDSETMRQIVDLLKDMNTMMDSLEDYTREDFINVIEDGADLYADYFRKIINMKYKILNIDKPNANNRTYPKDVVEKAIQKYKEDMVDKARSLIFDKPSNDRYNNLENVYGLVTNIFIEDQSVFIEYKSLTVPKADAITKKIEEGKLHFVTSGIGQINDGIVSEYELTSIFLHEEPSHII